MVERRTWVEDELSADDYDPPAVERGSADLYSSSENHPTVKRPIGFMRRKPRIRVKAWMMPIIPS